MNDIHEDDGSWTVWAKYILKTIEELKKGTSDNNELIQKLKIELRIIQTKMGLTAAIVGIIAGLIPSIISLIYFLHKLEEHGFTP